MAMAADTVAAPQEIRLFVEMEQGVREWRVDPVHGRLVAVPDAQRRAPPTVEWHHERARQESAARAAVSATRGYAASRYDLAIPSPDCRQAVVLTGRISVVDPYSKAFRGELPALAVHADVTIPKDRAFATAAWSADSRYVVLLDEHRQVGKSRGGAAKSPDGDGVAYASYSISIVDTTTGKIARANAAQEVRYGSALLLGSRGTCPAGR